MTTSPQIQQLNTHGLNPHPSPVSAHMPVIAGRCPACGSRSLFLAVGGHPTCSIIGCTDPTAVADALCGDGDWSFTRTSDPYPKVSNEKES